MSFIPLPPESCTIPAVRTTTRFSSTWSLGTIINDSESYSELWMNRSLNPLKPAAMTRVDGIHYFLFHINIGDIVATYHMCDDVKYKYLHSVVSIDFRGITLRRKTFLHKKTMKFLRYSINKNRLPFIIPPKSLMLYRFLYENRTSDDIDTVHAYPHLERSIFGKAVETLLGCGTNVFETRIGKAIWYNLLEEFESGNVYALSPIADILLKKTGPIRNSVMAPQVLFSVNKALVSLKGKILDTTFDNCVATMDCFSYHCCSDDIEDLLI